ncbi:hypothetical protein TNCV_4068221 [Trichonephila clavipes]|nr:hypothetical protein TNCV_4068221 [Trichonephila clavipes]
MRLQERKGTVDGYEWRCRNQSKDNRHDVVRSVRKGTWFSESKLAITIILRLTRYWFGKSMNAFVVNDDLTVTSWWMTIFMNSLHPSQGCIHQRNMTKCKRKSAGWRNWFVAGLLHQRLWGRPGLKWVDFYDAGHRQRPCRMIMRHKSAYIKEKRDLHTHRVTLGAIKPTPVKFGSHVPFREKRSAKNVLRKLTPKEGYTRAFGDGPRNVEPWSSDEDNT